MKLSRVTALPAEVSNDLQSLPIKYPNVIVRSVCDVNKALLGIGRQGRIIRRTEPERFSGEGGLFNKRPVHPELTKSPVVGQCLRPIRIHLKRRSVRCGPLGDER